MQTTVMNRLSTSLAATLLCVASAGLGACGGPAEPVKSSPPAKMAWGGSDATTTTDEEPAEVVEKKAEEPAPEKAAAPDPSALRPGEIDLDAAPASTESAPAAEAEPEESGPASSDPVAAELQRRRNEKARKAGKGKKSKPPKSAAASGEPGARSYTGSDPCKAGSFSVPRVRDACAAGGRAAAKRVMKDAISKATATGQTLKCANCHSNQRDYSLKSNAVKDLKRWLDG
jgi:hypothetical protein